MFSYSFTGHYIEGEIKFFKSQNSIQKNFMFDEIWNEGSQFWCMHIIMVTINKAYQYRNINVASNANKYPQTHIYEHKKRGHFLENESSD